MNPSSSQNALSGETYGLELSAQWQVIDHWRLRGSYSWLHMRLSPNNSDALNSPQQQFQIMSYVDLPGHLEFNGAVDYVDRTIPPFGASRMHIAAYVRLDLGLSWHPTRNLELGIWGQNLLDNQHPEFTSFKTPLVTEVPRSVLGKITLRF